MAMTEVGIRLALDGQQQVQAGISGVASRLDALDDNARQAASGAQTLKTAMASLATVGSVVALVKMADAVTTLQTQLRLSANTATEATRAYGALFDIAQQGRVSFTELGNTYAGIARAGKELGISQDRLLNVTKSISQAMTIGGGSAQAMQAALVQLGQGLSSGTLRGEELNSIMEQTPRLAKAIADGLGVTTGELRKLGAAGELTAQQVISALEKAGPALSKEMESATLTVGQAFTMLANSTTKFVGDADQASGASATLAGALKGVSSAIDTVGGAINNNKVAFATIAGGLGGAAAIAGLAAVAANIGKVRTAFIALSAVMAANPITLTLLGIGAAIGAANSLIDARAKSLEGMKSTLKELEALNARANTALYGTKVSDEVYKKRQEDIARLRGEIANLEAATDSYGKVESARLAEGTAAWKDQEKAQKDVSALWSTLSKTPEAYVKAMQEIGRLHQSGALTGQAYLNAIDAAHQLLPKAAASTKQLSDAQKLVADGQKLYNDLMAEASGYNADFTEQVTALAAAYQQTDMSAQTYAAALARILEKQNGAVAAAKAQADAEKATAQARRDAIADQDKTVTSIQNALEAQRAHNKTIGLSVTAIAELEAATMDLQAAELERMATLQDGVMWDSAMTERYLAEAAALRALAAEKTAGVQKQVAADAAQDMAKEQKKAAEESAKYWEDALMRAFESGKGFFESLWDTIKNTLKTQVLKVLVSGVVGGGSSASFASEALGSGNALSSLTNLYSGVSNLVTIGTQVAAGTMSAANALGTIAANATGTGISGLLATNGAYGTAAGAAGSAGSMMAAAGPWIAAAVALYAVAKATKGETRAGGQYGYSMDGSSVYDYRRGKEIVVIASGVGANYLGGPSGGDPYGEVAKAAINSTVDHINDLFKGMGSTTAIAAFQAGYESSTKGRGGVFAGGALNNGATFGESGYGDNYQGTLYDSTKGFSLDAKQAIEAFSLDLKQATIEALQAATDIPAVISDMIQVDAKSLSDEAATALLTSIDAIVVDVNTLRGALDTLPFAALRDLSFDAAAGLIAAAGNLQTLATNLGGYYDNFYSEAEKTAQLTSVMGDGFKTLGLEMPTEGLKEWYRAQVEAAMAADQSVPANAKLTASLLSMQGGVKALDDATTAAKASQAEYAASIIGYDAGGLSKMIMEAALNPEDGMDAATSFAAALKTTMTEALMNSAVSEISTSIFNSIVTPMLLGQAVSDAVLDEITNTAIARMDALGVVLNSPEFQAALDRVADSVGGFIGKLSGYAKDANAATSSVGSGGSSSNPGNGYAYNPDHYGATFSDAYREQNPVDFGPAQSAYKDALQRMQDMTKEFWDSVTEATDDSLAGRAAEIVKSITEEMEKIHADGLKEQYGTDIGNVLAHGGVDGLTAEIAAMKAEAARLAAGTNPFLPDGQMAPGDAAKLEQINQTIKAFEEGLAAYNKYLEELENLTDEEKKIREEAIAAQTAALYADAKKSLMEQYKPELTQADAAKQIADAGFDISGLDSEGIRKYFYDLLNGADALTEEGQGTIGTIDGLGDAIDALMNSAEDAAAALEKTNQGIQDQIDVLTGARTQTQVDRDNALADATDDTTKALLEQLWKLQDAATNQSWQDKIDILTGATTQADLDMARELANATDATTKALIEQYYAQLKVAEASNIQKSLLEQYQPATTTEGATAALEAAGLDTSGLAGLSESGIEKWFADIVAAADPTTEAGQALLKMLEGLTDEIDVLAQAAAKSQQITDSLQETGANKAIELLRAQGREEEALALERAKAIEGMTDEQIALYDSNQAIQDQIDAINAYNAAMSNAGATADSLAVQLLTAQGDTEGAKQLQREQEMAKATAGLTGTYLEEAQAAIEANWATQDLIDALNEQAALAKTNAGLQDRLDVLLGNKTQQEVDRAAELAAATDDSTKALLEQIYAQEDMAAAAAASIEAMKQLSQELDQIANFRTSIGDAQQGIRSQMAGYDPIAYGQSQVDKYREQLAGATTTEDRLEAGGQLRDAIVGRYNAELDAINKNRAAAEQSARAAFDAQVEADNKAIQAANELNAAYRQIGEYVKGLIVSADAPYSLSDKYAAAQADYSTTLALARAGDKDALGKLTGAQGNLLSTAKEQSVSSVDYARTFGRTINELSALAAKAGPDLEAVTRQFYFDSSAFDAQALELQTNTVTELEDLAKLTDEWTKELQDKLAEEALVFSEIGLNTKQTADYTSQLGPGFERVAAAIDAATAAQRSSDSLLAEIQGLRTEVAALRAVSQKTADNTKATADTLDSVSGGGGPLLVQTA